MESRSFGTERMALIESCLESESFDVPYNRC